jgi:hypothetical protein
MSMTSEKPHPDVNGARRDLIKLGGLGIVTLASSDGGARAFAAKGGRRIPVGVQLYSSHPRADGALSPPIRGGELPVTSSENREQHQSGEQDPEGGSSMRRTKVAAAAAA